MGKAPGRADASVQGRCEHQPEHSLGRHVAAERTARAFARMLLVGDHEVADRAQSWCRCGQVEVSPGADVEVGEPNPGADVARGEPT